MAKQTDMRMTTMTMVRRSCELLLLLLVWGLRKKSGGGSTDGRGEGTPEGDVEGREVGVWDGVSEGAAVVGRGTTMDSTQRTKGLAVKSPSCWVNLAWLRSKGRTNNWSCHACVVVSVVEGSNTP